MLTVTPHCAGIGYSDDKLLQTRIFSYADTQRHRLGPNYLMLPVNAPKCPHHNNHHDGFMNFMHRDEEVNVWRWRALAASCKPVIPQRRNWALQGLVQCHVAQEAPFKLLCSIISGPCSVLQYPSPDGQGIIIGLVLTRAWQRNFAALPQQSDGA